MHEIQFGSIEPPPHRRKSSSQCSMNRDFRRSADCLRRVRISQPHKMPADATNSRIQLCCHGPHRFCPSLGEWLLAEDERTRQGTSVPQKYRVYLHCCRIPGGLSNRFRRESDVIGIEAEDTLREECPKVRVWAETGTLSFLAVDLIPATPSWPSGCILPSLMARRAAKCFSTSTFLIRLIGAPAVLFISSAALYQAAEDTRLRYCRLPVVALTGLPIASPDTTSSTLRFCWRPVALSFEDTGEVLPKPVALTEFATTPSSTR